MAKKPENAQDELIAVSAEQIASLRKLVNNLLELHKWQNTALTETYRLLDEIEPSSDTRKSNHKA
ncbi:MAG: hypothetical protein JXD22_04815 [Sedimentisphaerales bacterium]|nr:hypothetical protein [Sedimentisphaerales bacterium]